MPSLNRNQQSRQQNQSNHDGLDSASSGANRFDRLLKGLRIN